MMSKRENNKNKKTLSDLKTQLKRLGYGSSVTSGTTPGTSIDELRRTFRKKKARQAGTGPAPSSGAGRTRRPNTACRPLLKEEAVVYRRAQPRAGAHPSAEHDQSRPPVKLTEAVEGEVVSGPAGRTCFHVYRPAAEVAGTADLDSRFADLLAESDSVLSRRLALVLPGGIGLEDLLFMDIETTGLSSSPLFLIGVMIWTDGGFEVRQFLARNYAEERPVIAAFVEACASRRLLVTFNGKSFDFPYIRTRAAATGVPFSVHPAHLDLLHVSRRFWRDSLPNCKLQTLERFICDRRREGDIPGSEIPEAYHTYVRTDNACQIVRILEHNLLDLITLADIMTRFPDEY